MLRWRGFQRILEITPSDPSTDELVVTPSAVKALVQLSNEAVSDAQNPDVLNMTGNSLARSVGKKVDAALFSLAAVTNGPQHTLGTESYSYVDTGTIGSIANLDYIHDGIKLAADHGAAVTAIVVNPATALQLAKLKVLTSGSNQSLINGSVDGLLIGGAKVVVSPAVDALTFAWLVDASQVFTVQRTGTTVARSTDAAFSADATQVRVTARVAFGIANAAGVVRLFDHA